MPYPGRKNIYEAAIRRMVEEAMEVQEQEFACSHEHDSDEQLESCLRTCARVIGHSPWRREIVGGSLIERRFGSWENALRSAGLPMPSHPDKLAAFARYQEEVARQKELYRQKKAEKKKKVQMKKEKQTV